MDNSERLEKAILAIKKLNQKIDNLSEPIAIIGLSCTFPGAKNVDEFWQLLQGGKDGICDIPASRWDVNAYYDANPEVPGKMITRKGGFIEEIDKFDANFFAISPREAEYLDPQQRLLLEQTWHALEHANIAASSLKETKAGVFIGIATQDYHDLLNQYCDRNDINPYMGTGISLSTATGRISYILGLQGPNMAIETACSSSLVALHEACKSLQRGESDLALVGGVNAMLIPETFISFSKALMLAPDGHCKTFDAKADGYARGEGCGMVILKRLSEATRDKDRILAIIKASGVNQDGASGGLTVPNGEAQERLLHSVLDEAKLNSADIDYVECHGTGTSLGDPIEVHALEAVYGRGRDKGNPLYLSAVKSNIGHLEAAAGIASLIKVVLALQHKEIPQTLNFQKLNPHIELSFPVEIVTKTIPWPRCSETRYAAVSAFGFSGTNAHVILEASPAENLADVEEGNWVVCLSAKTPTALEQIIKEYIEYLEAHPEVQAQDFVYTANKGRSRLEHQMQFAAATRKQLLENLKNKTSTNDPECTPRQGNIITLPSYPFEKERFWFPFPQSLTQSHVNTISPILGHQVEMGLSNTCVYEQIVSIAYPEFTADHQLNNVPLLSGTAYIACMLKAMDVQYPQESFSIRDFRLSKSIIFNEGLEYRLQTIMQLSEKQLIEVQFTSRLKDQIENPWDINAEARIELIKESLKPLLLDIQKLKKQCEENRIEGKSYYDLLQSKLCWRMVDHHAWIKNVAASDTKKLAELRLPDSIESVYGLHPGCIESLAQLAFGLFFDETLNGLVVPKKIGQIDYFSGKGVPSWAYVEIIDVRDKSSAVCYLLDNQGRVILQISGFEFEKMSFTSFDRLVQQSLSKSHTIVNYQDIPLQASVIKPKRSLSKTFLLSVIAEVHFAPEEHIENKDQLTLLVAQAEGLNQFKKALSTIVLQNKQQIYCVIDVTLADVDLLVTELIHSSLPVSILCLLVANTEDNTSIRTCIPLYHAVQKQAPQWTVYLLGSDFAEKGEKINLKRLMDVQKLIFSHPVIIEADKQYIALAWQGAELHEKQKKSRSAVIASDALDKLKNVSAEEQRVGVIQFLQTLLSKVSGHSIENLPINKGFFDLGLDSIMSVELKNQVQGALGKDIKLSDTATFEYPNIEALADHLCLLKFGTKAMVMEQNTAFVAHDKIAIVGMACRLPGASSVEDFWNLLNEGRDAIEEVPASRWNIDAYYDADDTLPNKMYTRKGGFISNIEQFDSTFFATSPREAEYMDPQQRLLLETSWLALEDANATANLKESNTGVFIGICNNDYQHMLIQLNKHESLQASSVTNGLYAASARISYALGLQGPCVSLDSACSSSLVAVDNACRSLQSGDCNMALAGGVNLILSPETSIQICQAKMLSPDGKCKTFDESADGYVRGEGCGVVVLKRLSDAEKDGDNILAVISGTGVNQDGASSGFTVPNGLAQEKVFNKALERAQIRPDQVSYIECHGTGTSLGDPIEVGSIQRTYGQHREKNNPLYLGAVKSNIGHLEGAAGIASLIKAVLCLQHKKIVKTLHHKKTNPKIHLDEFNGIIADDAVDWVGVNNKRIAAISSFGATGTNAHVILEEAPEIKITDTEEDDWVLCLSAKTPTALEQVIQDYIVYLESHPTVRMKDLVYTVNHCRARLDCQAYFAAVTVNELLGNLKNKKSRSSGELTPKQGNKIALPAYPFEKQNYWLDIGVLEPSQFGEAASDTHPLLVRLIELPEDGKHLFESLVTNAWPEFMPDHYIYGKPVVAGATWISSMVSAIECLHETKQGKIVNIEFIQPLVLENNTRDQRVIRIQVHDQEEAHTFKISSFGDVNDNHIAHAQGQYELEAIELPSITESLESIKVRCPNIYYESDHHQRAQELSLYLGPHFSWIEEVYYSDTELLAKMRLPDKVESKRYLLYPGFIDSCFQALFAWMGKDATVLSIPVAIKSFTYDVRGSKPEYVYIRLPENADLGKNAITSINIYILDKYSQVLGFIEKFEARAVPETAFLNVLSKQNQDNEIDCFYVEQWIRQTIPDVETKFENIEGTSVLLVAGNENPIAVKTIQEFVQHQVQVGEVHTVGEFDALLKKTSVGIYSDVFFMFHDAQTNEQEQDVPKAYYHFLHQLFDLTKILLNHSWEEPPRLWIIGAGIQTVVPHEKLQLSLAGISGFYKTLVQERPEFRARLIDFESTTEEEETLRQAKQLVSRWKHVVVHPDDRETLCAYREEECYVARLMHQEEQRQLDHYRVVPAEPYRLTFESGSMISINFTAYHLPETLAPDEVELAIEAAALNFRDVLSVQGLYPGDAGAVGGDCCGVVQRVGKKVKHLNVGDRVMGMSVGTFASCAIGSSDWLVRCPDFLDSAKASTLPSVFCTSYVALVELAQLKAKEVVLIHSASGGVGLSAIQIAQHIGAQVIATASSVRKRAYLKSLGVEHVFDSRSFVYVDSIKALTQGKGVDVVLNFLVGDFIEQTLKISKKKARFIEIGKRDIYSHEQMQKVRPDIDYHIYALDEMMRAQPEKIKTTLKVLIDGLEEGIYSALPATEFPFTRIVSAFNYMGRSKHIGKIVLIPPKAVWSTIQPDVPILIIGGLGGIGYALAQWCLAQGARQVVLSGRKALNKDLQTKLDPLGKEVRYEQLDITNAKEVQGLFKHIKIQVVFNTAGLLEDATLDALTWDSVQRVSMPKVDGSWNLYKALCSTGQQHVPVISFSSIASILGSAGQAHYAAANSFINAFTFWCAQRGITSKSIAWGAWADVGMAKDLAQRHARSGIEAIKPQRALKLLQEVVQTPGLPEHLMVAKVRWNKIPVIVQTAFLDKLTSKTQKNSGDLLVYLQKLEPEKRLEALQDRIRDLLAEVMGMSVSFIANDKGFFDLGMDSLMAVEFRNRLQAQIGQANALQSTLIFDHPNIEKLAEKLGQQLKLTELKHRISDISRAISPEEPIAIIGLSCNFPGARNATEFWDLLQQGKDGVQEIPSSRWDISAHYDADPDAPGKMITRKGGFIQDIDQFDAGFFSISPLEAEVLDPQQRLLLEQTWQALEHANIDPYSLKGSQAGVFVGMGTQDYYDLLNHNVDRKDINAYMGTGNTFSTATGRISYILGLQGPNMAIETACSSSLVALHEACKSLQRGESSLAITGGVNALLAPELFINFSKAHMLAPDGHCKTFDEKADGYARGEGCGIVILKRLSDALLDNDTVFAVIKASGINQDGASSGLTVPNGEAQEQLLRRVLAEAKLNPGDIDYVECHGTGTSLGDPIEVRAIGAVYGKDRKKERRLKLSSVKSNIGHLEAAAGVAGLIKTVLALKHKEIPGTLHFHRLNPHIDLDFPAEIVTDTKQWESYGKLRCAAVSAFGFSGTNAHVILEEAPVANKIPIQDGNWVLRLSAKTPIALEQMIKDYSEYIEAHPEANIQDIVFTANTGRTKFEFRAYFVATTREMLQDNLKSNTTTSETEKTPEKANKIILPNYPFEKQSYWYSNLIDPQAQNQLKNNYTSRSDQRNPDLLSKMLTLVKKTPSTEQNQFILNYLAVMLNQIAGTSLELFRPSITLQDYGVDSLMLSTLVNRIQMDLGITLNISDFQTSMDLNKLSLLLTAKLSEHTPVLDSVVYDHRQFKVLSEIKDPKFQLFLIPPFGFGEDAFSNWPNRLSNDIEVIYLGYQFKDSWNTMIALMAESIKNQVKTPFIIYGHSMGGIIAYELTVYLETHMQLYPVALMISSSSTPVQFERIKYTFPFNQITKDKGDESLSLLVQAHYLPPKEMPIKMVSSEEIHSDVCAIQSYCPKGIIKLSTPITSVHANNDVLVPDGNLVSEWSHYTDSSFSYFEIEGTHLFFKNPPTSLFDAVGSAFKVSGKELSFVPQIYQLKEYTSGSNSNLSYPLGLEPRGFILYDELSKAMAVHLWDSRVQDNLKCNQGSREATIVELMLASMSYCGHYTLHSGIINHEIKLSLVPNSSGDVLARSYRYENENLILSTLPKTMKKQTPELYQTLLWGPGVKNVQSSPLVGCWELIDYTENSDHILGERPIGQLIITNSGYISLQMGSANRVDFENNNLFLASNEELELAYRSYRSLFGMYKMNLSKLLMEIEVLSPVPFEPHLNAHYQWEKDELLLMYSINTKNINTEISARFKSNPALDR